MIINTLSSLHIQDNFTKERFLVSAKEMGKEHTEHKAGLNNVARTRLFDAMLWRLQGNKINKTGTDHFYNGCQFKINLTNLIWD